MYGRKLSSAQRRDAVIEPLVGGVISTQLGQLRDRHWLREAQGQVLPPRDTHRAMHCWDTLAAPLSPLGLQPGPHMGQLLLWGLKSGFCTWPQKWGGFPRNRELQPQEISVVPLPGPSQGGGIGISPVLQPKCFESFRS